MISVFQHPWLRGLFGDAEAEKIWAPEAQLGHYAAFEVALAHALEKTGRVPTDCGARAAKAIQSMRVDPVSLSSGTARDGLPIPELVRHWRAAAGSNEAAVHTGATSQDVLDTALALTLRNLTDVILSRIGALGELLVALLEAHGKAPLPGRTRMQAALPITVAQRLDTWRAPLVDHMERLAALRPQVERLQLGEAVGSRQAIDDDAGSIARLMAEELGLHVAPRIWHTDRSGLATYAGFLSLITGTLGKMGQDIALMAQQGIDEIALRGGGGSSAMPHKSNPVLAELLVTLARYNATVLAGMHHALVHEQERSGAAWMLEWMILPQMTMTTCRALAAGDALCRQIDRLGAMVR